MARQARLCRARRGLHPRRLVRRRRRTAGWRDRRQPGRDRVDGGRGVRAGPARDHRRRTARLCGVAADRGRSEPRTDRPRHQGQPQADRPCRQRDRTPHPRLDRRQARAEDRLARRGSLARRRERARLDRVAARPACRTAAGRRGRDRRAGRGVPAGTKGVAWRFHPRPTRRRACPWLCLHEFGIARGGTRRSPGRSSCSRSPASARRPR